MNVKRVAFGLALLVLALLFQLGSVSPVQADTFAYIGYQTGAFGTIDLNTGEVTAITSSIGINPAGFGEIGGTLYTATYSNGTLYTVNTATGALTTVGTSSGNSYHDFGSTPTGLYVADGNTDLYSVSSSNGAATQLGPITVPVFSSYRALSTNSSILYYADNNNLYTLNAANGAATLVGPFGSSIVMTALMMDNGIMYGADESGNFYTINTTTGAATPDPSIPNVGGAVWALAPVPSAVPIPPTALLFAPGLAGLAAVRRRFKK